MAGAAQRQEDLFPAASGPELIRAHQKVSQGAADSIPSATLLPPALPRPDRRHAAAPLDCIQHLLPALQPAG